MGKSELLEITIRTAGPDLPITDVIYTVYIQYNQYIQFDLTVSRQNPGKQMVISGKASGGDDRVNLK